MSIMRCVCMLVIWGVASLAIGGCAVEVSAPSSVSSDADMGGSSRASADTANAGDTMQPSTEGMADVDMQDSTEEDSQAISLIRRWGASVRRTLSPLMRRPLEGMRGIWRSVNRLSGQQGTSFSSQAIIIIGAISVVVLTAVIFTVILI